MNIENDYPVIKKKINRFFKIRKIILIIYFIGLITSLIVNLSVGGRLWFIYVLGGEIITYYAFLSKPLIDNRLIKRFSILLLCIILYLHFIDLVNTTNWSYIVINIISFSLIILQFIFFFINYENHKNKIILMIITDLISVTIFILSLCRVLPINWAVIVMGSLGSLSLLILFTFYFKTTKLKLKKYLSLK